MNEIRIEDIATFCEVVAGLQANGLRFKSHVDPSDNAFVIEVTGH